MEGIDAPDGQVQIDGVEVDTFQSNIHINDEDNRISGTSYLADISGTEGYYEGYYIALDFNSVTSDMSDVDTISARVVNGEESYSADVDSNGYLLIQIATDETVDLDNAVLTLQAADISHRLLYENEYDLFGIQLVIPEPPVPSKIEGIAPNADFSSQNILIDENNEEITGTVSATTVSGDAGYYISLDFSSVTSDMSDVAGISYLASDARGETVDEGYVTDDIATILVAETDMENILAKDLVIEAVDAEDQILYHNHYDVSSITLSD